MDSEKIKEMEKKHARWFLQVMQVLPTVSFSPSKRGYLMDFLGYIGDPVRYLDSAKQLNSDALYGLALEHMAIRDIDPVLYAQCIS